METVNTNDDELVKLLSGCGKAKNGTSSAKTETSLVSKKLTLNVVEDNQPINNINFDDSFDVSFANIELDNSFNNIKIEKKESIQFIKRYRRLLFWFNWQQQQKDQSL